MFGFDMGSPRLKVQGMNLDPFKWAGHRFRDYPELITTAARRHRPVWK